MLPLRPHVLRLCWPKHGKPSASAGTAENLTYTAARVSRAGTSMGAQKTRSGNGNKNGDESVNRKSNIRTMETHAPSIQWSPGLGIYLPVLAPRRQWLPQRLTARSIKRTPDSIVRGSSHSERRDLG